MSGRHLSTLAMKTSERFNSMALMIFVSNWPAKPTKGSPSRSSSAPGASPTNMIRASMFPTPNTVCVRVRARTGHFRQEATAERA